MGRARSLRVLSVLLVGAGFALVGRQAYMQAKAALAAVLIDRAWAAEQRDGLPHRPWWWADLHPVARLEVPRLGVRQTILSGAAGSSLAFGLGHLSGTSLPGEPGNCGIAGHRDSWASFMKDLRVGDEVRLETRDGSTRYRVNSIAVLPKERTDVLEPDGGRRITLVTCWPFSGLLHGPWRFVVQCEIEPALVVNFSSRSQSKPAPTPG